MPVDAGAVAVEAPGTHAARPAGLCAVVFGAGDFTGRLIMPTLCNLAVGRWLPDEFTLLGVDMVTMSTDQQSSKFRNHRASSAGQGAAQSLLADDGDTVGYHV